MKLTDEQIIKALECCTQEDYRTACKDCPCDDMCYTDLKSIDKFALDLINRQKAEIERLKNLESLEKFIYKKAHNIGTALECYFVDKEARDIAYESVINKLVDIEIARKEGIKELSEKITEVFMRYAHLHSYAEGARKDYIETVDGKEIEMQSVWDVITLQMNGIAEYEEMSRLQKNIETIEKERLLTELEKDFRLLVKEMAGE